LCQGGIGHVSREDERAVFRADLPVVQVDQVVPADRIVSLRRGCDPVARAAEQGVVEQFAGHVIVFPHRDQQLLLVVADVGLQFGFRENGMPKDIADDGQKGRQVLVERVER